MKFGNEGGRGRQLHRRWVSGGYLLHRRKGLRRLPTACDYAPTKEAMRFRPLVMFSVLVA